MTSTRAQWGSRLGFVLAAAGSAVGLGNIWKFPYITGENGGGLFVLIYLVCIALVGIPIMMAEIMIGRAAQKQPVAAFHTLQGKRTPWAAVGWMGVFSGFIILSFYIVVAGWAMDYTLKSVVNFTGPMHEQASVAGSTYRATTDLDVMRATLADRRAEREEDAAVRAIRLELKPSAWDTYAQYTEAVSAAPDQDEARRRLLLDAAWRERVESVEALQPRIAAAKQAARDEARAHYAALDDSIVLDEGEALARRNAIADGVGAAFGALATDGWTCSLWSIIFMAITIIIVARGVSGGIERTCRVLMPTLIGLMVVMVVYGMFQPGFGRAFAFVFKPDVSKLEASGVLEALGHAFFTLSLGMGAMITYGSYQKTKDGLASQSLLIALLDTVIALLACLMIFPIIFTYDQAPGAGPGLVFVSMPLAFAEIGSGGMLLAILFFGLLVFAALTSSISLLEVVASYFIDEQGWSRPRAAWIIGAAIFAFSVPAAFAMDPSRLMEGWDASFGVNFFDVMDYLTSNWMLPLGGLFIAIYAGWVMPRRWQEAEIEGMAPVLFTGWLWLVRIVAPALVILVLLQKVGILDADELLHPIFH